MGIVTQMRGVALGLVCFVACGPAAPPVAPPAPSAVDADAAVDLCNDDPLLWVSSEAGAPCPPPSFPSFEMKDDPLSGGPRDNLIHGE